MVYDTDRDTLVQAVANGNPYHVNDVFFTTTNRSGDTYQYQGQGELLDTNTGVSYSVQHFAS